MTVSDQELTHFLAGRADRAELSDLRARVLEEARATPQLAHVDRAPLATRPVAWRMLVGAVVGLAIVALILARLPVAGPSPGAPSPSSGPASATGDTAPADPTDAPVTPPPYAPGSCPVTPVSFLRRGQVPIVRASGVDWNFGGIAWMAEVGQKLVFPTTVQADAVAAERLPTPGAPGPLSVRYPAGGGPGFVFGVGLPSPGCWLLTEAGTGSGSSIVVQAAKPPAQPQSAASQNVPTKTVDQTDSDECPATPVDPADAFRSWVDGSNRWTDPDRAMPWMAGKPRKLVLTGPIASAAPFRLVVALRLGSTWAGVDQRSAFVSDEPIFASPNWSESSAVELNLPHGGCWAISDIDPTQTSTIVVEIGG